MSIFPLGAALLALLPAMTGPVAADKPPMMLDLSLCSGGMVSVPLDDLGDAPDSGTAPCCAKGCHAAGQRKKTNPCP